MGIAVHSLAAACPLYQLLGLEPAASEEISSEGVRVVMLPTGSSRIELLEPTRPDSPVARFLDRRGEGLHHIALRVPDLAAAAARLRQAGIRLVNHAIQTGAGGHRYVFVHPSSAGGVLIELVEPTPPAPAQEPR